MPEPKVTLRERAAEIADSVAVEHVVGAESRREISAAIEAALLAFAREILKPQELDIEVQIAALEPADSIIRRWA